VNAGKNILIKALRTVGHTGTYPWGELPSWAIGVNLSSNGESMNQESPTITLRVMVVVVSRVDEYIINSIDINLVKMFDGCQR